MQFKDSEHAVRLDKWLWAARFFKTRALATEAISGGKVHVNGERVKPGKKIDVGVSLQITQGPYQKHVIVKRIFEKRGPATVAQTMYEETVESVQKRENLQDQMKYVNMGVQQDGRPTKKDRRQLRKFKYSE